VSSVLHAPLSPSRGYRCRCSSSHRGGWASYLRKREAEAPVSGDRSPRRERPRGEDGQSIAVDANVQHPQGGVHRRDPKGGPSYAPAAAQPINLSPAAPETESKLPQNGVATGTSKKKIKFCSLPLHATGFLFFFALQPVWLLCSSGDSECLLLTKTCMR